MWRESSGSTCQGGVSREHDLSTLRLYAVEASGQFKGSKSTDVNAPQTVPGTKSIGQNTALQRARWGSHTPGFCSLP